MVATPREIELAAHYIVDRFGVKVMQEEVEGEGENRVEAAEVRGEVVYVQGRATRQGKETGRRAEIRPSEQFVQGAHWQVTCCPLLLAALLPHAAAFQAHVSACLWAAHTLPSAAAELQLLIVNMPTWPLRSCTWQTPLTPSSLSCLQGARTLPAPGADMADRERDQLASALERLAEVQKELADGQRSLMVGQRQLVEQQAKLITLMNSETQD